MTRVVLEEKTRACAHTDVTGLPGAKGGGTQECCCALSVLVRIRERERRVVAATADERATPELGGRVSVARCLCRKPHTVRHMHLHSRGPVARRGNSPSSGSIGCQEVQALLIQRASCVVFLFSDKDLFPKFQIKYGKYCSITEHHGR